MRRIAVRGARIDFNPRPPHGGRHRDDVPEAEVHDTSIHALHMEGDSLLGLLQQCVKNFNPRPLQTGGDIDKRVDKPVTTISIHVLQAEGDINETNNVTMLNISIRTLHMKGDVEWSGHIHPEGYFNPHPPHGGRLVVLHHQRPRRPNSIRALRMESDFYPDRIAQHAIIFQSTPSAWRATPHQKTLLQCQNHFNPRPCIEGD